MNFSLLTFIGKSFNGARLKNGSPAEITSTLSIRTTLISTLMACILPIWIGMALLNQIISASNSSGDWYAFSALVCAGALLLLAVTVRSADYQSNQIKAAMQALITPAIASECGEIQRPPPLRLREIDEVAKALEKAFQRRTDERDKAKSEKDIAERAAFLKDEFIGTVSHELRTPLTSITASLGLLSNAASVSPDVTKRLIAIALSNSQRLVRLVNDILDIEKLEAGKVIFNIERIDVCSLIERAIEANHPIAENCGVTMHVGTMDNCDVQADADRMMQVISNLLSNAIKFSPRGTEVLLSVHDRDQIVRITIADHGSGIPKDFRNRAFEKFAQADTSGINRKDGTGLGLSIVKEIVQRLGGEVGFWDATDGGTVFYVDLPQRKGMALSDRLPPVESKVGIHDAA